ncbi:YdgH/BhsA/McbA-like domain containing protein [Klebsiella pneumoniae]|nr:DUF1471 domain-containing protein [Klebsiella pneumoniae]
MKLKNTLLASALLTTATLSAHAATELTPEQAAALKPYDRVVVTGRFNAIGDAVQAVSRKADKDGAASFYVVDTSDYGNGGNWRVTADLYKEDAPKADAPKNRIINGVMELPKDQAVELMPYDTVTVQGFYRSQPEVNDATTAAVGSGTGVGRFFETQSSKGGRYTVTLPNGTKVEEVNKVTAAQMVPFDNIQFTGNYGNMTEISYQTAKRAAKKGAKYYHITRQWQERGGNITISADLYK